MADQFRSGTRPKRPLVQRWLALCAGLATMVAGASLLTPQIARAGANPHPIISKADAAVPSEASIWLKQHPISNCSDIPGGHRDGPNLICSGTCPQLPSHTNCQGKDPGAQGCGAFTNQSVYDGTEDGRADIYTDNRYSTACESNWSRTETNGIDALALSAGIWYCVNDCGGAYFSTVTSKIMWSVMDWSPANGSYPCVLAYGGSDYGGNSTKCF
jgi:hypothetical protein